MRQNAVLMKDKLVPFLDVEEAALLARVEEDEALRLNAARDVHYACGWKGAEPDLEKLIVSCGSVVWLFGWVVVWLVVWLVDWLFGWLLGCCCWCY